MSTETVLITGGAGFIGTNTAQALCALGKRVRVLDNFDPQVHGNRKPDDQMLQGDVELLIGDVRDAAAVDRALDGVDRVLHLAALTGVGQSMYDLQSYADVNVTGTANLLERILRSDRSIERLVLSSSRAVYGEGTFRCDACGPVYPPGRDRAALERGDFAVRCPRCAGQATPVSTAESRPLHPISYYGWTKRCQEDQVSFAATNFDLPVTTLRYFNVYGAGQSLVNPYTGIVSIFYSRLVNGGVIDVYERGVPVRDFVHVSDVVKANVRALSAPLTPGSVINVGTGVSSGIGDVATVLAETLGRTSELVFTDRYRIGDIHSCVADTTLLEDELGVQATTTLADGLNEFVQWADGRPTTDMYESMLAELESFGLSGGSATDRTG